MIFCQNLEPNTKEIDTKLLNILDVLKLFSENIRQEDIDNYDYYEYILNLFGSFIELDILKKEDFLRSEYEVFIIYQDIINFDFTYKKKNQINEINEKLEDYFEEEKTKEKKKEDKIIDNPYSNYIKSYIGYIFSKNKIFEEIYKQYKKVILDIFEIPEKRVINKKDFKSDKLNSFLIGLEIDRHQSKINNIQNMQDVNDLIYKINQKKIIEIFNKLFINADSLKFLLSISSTDCINMQEFAGEVYGGNNQNFLSLEDLRFIEKLVKLFEKIKSYDYQTNKNDEQKIIALLRKELEPEEDNIIKYINNYHQYEQFFNENLNKNKFVSETIQKILNKSEFFLLNNDNKMFNGFIKNDE